jgi:hypothetical protein
MAAGTVTYVTPVAGATAPTKPQAAGVNLVQADVQFADTNTAANIVHNMGLSAAGANGRPILSWVLTAAGAALNNVVLAVVDANTISVTPGVVVGATTIMTVRVNIQRGPTAGASL